MNFYKKKTHDEDAQDKTPLVLIITKFAKH